VSRDTITIELSDREALELAQLLRSRLEQIATTPESQSIKEEQDILGLLLTKLFIKSLFMAMREENERQGRMN
jgi:hypothetical protein